MLAQQCNDWVHVNYDGPETRIYVIVHVMMGAIASCMNQNILYGRLLIQYDICRSSSLCWFAGEQFIV